MGCSLRVVFHVSDHWHCFWPCYSTPMKAGRTRKGTEEDLKMNSFLPKQQGYHSPLSQAPWIFLSDFHIVSASQEERKLQNSECLLEYFLLNKEQEKKRKKKKSTADLISHLGSALTKEKLLNSATTSCPKPGIN